MLNYFMYDLYFCFFRGMVNSVISAWHGSLHENKDKTENSIVEEESNERTFEGIKSLLKLD